jgi:Mrp family chromosome partitioning ATPase/capsular polysaccharide biosynthesis protein
VRSRPVNEDLHEQKDLRAYLRPVLKRWWLIATIVPIVTIGTYAYYANKPKTYEAASELYVQPSTVGQLVFGGKGENETRIENLALLLQTGAVAERVEERLVAKAKRESKRAKGKAGARIPTGSIAAQAIEKSSFIVLTATAGSARAAVQLANAYAATFVEMQRQQIRNEARRAAKAAEAQLAAIGTGPATLHRREGLEQRIENLELIASQPTANGGVKQAERAIAASGPIDHNPAANAIFAFVISLMLAVGAAYGLEYLDRKIARIEDVEEIYELPVLTEIPQIDAPASIAHGGVAMPEALREPFQRLQANLEMQARERPLRTILIASAAPGEGKSIVARNLALAYREAGRNVAVIDADFRNANMGRMLGAREGLGLSDILAGRVSFGEVVQEVPVHAGTNGNGRAGGHVGGSGLAAPRGVRGELAIVTAGEGDRSLSPALSSPEMRETLQVAAEAYGTTIIDSPPLLAVADGLPLLAEADAAIVVTRLGVSTRESARRLLGELERVAGVHVAGVVVNGIPPRTHRARSYGYRYA